jgi:hypothetical protein
MIFTIRFISDEEEDFMMDIHIDSSQTFAMLHQIIQKTLKFDDSQLASFFVSNENWEKLDEITLLDMGGIEPARLMANTKLETFFSGKNQHMLYVFDYFAERLLFGSITQVTESLDSMGFPKVVKLEGHIPPQMMSDFEDELFSGEEMQDDDFDLEELGEDLEDFYPEEGKEKEL